MRSTLQSAGGGTCSGYLCSSGEAGDNGVRMSIDQQVRDAFDDLDELLNQGLGDDEAIAQAANGNGLKPDVFRARVLRDLGDLDEHRGKLALRAAAGQRERDFQELEKKVREEAAASAEHTYYACCLNDPELAGRPSWPMCVNGVVRRLEITDSRLANAVYESVYATVRRLDRKHGTSTAHFRD